jgi:hypothetical protein
MPRALERELYKEPQTVPSTRPRPPGINALAQGVSTRELPYLFDEPGGEYERSLVHPPNRSPVVRMYICSPLRRGSQVETRTPAITMYQSPNKCSPSE